jgi:RNA polymerase-interacting CarD/CdnL/TRCF family regulator
VELPPILQIGLAVFFPERTSLHLCSTSRQAALRNIGRGGADFKAGTNQQTTHRGATIELIEVSIEEVRGQPMLEQKQDTPFQVGDHIIHWVYGPGEIIEIEEKVLSGHTDEYYVVQMHNLTLWVPLDDSSEHCLRFPTQANDFQVLFQILASPGEPLSEDRLLRKSQLTALLKGRTLESTCEVIRDLVHYQRSNKLNENDNSILKRAWSSLLNEWSVVLSVPVKQAERELRDLLEMSVV